MIESKKDLIPCPLCGHKFFFSETSKHHIMPRSRGGIDTERICNTCRKQLHAYSTNKELEEFESLEVIKNSEPMKKYLKWAKKRKHNNRIKTKKAKRRIK